MTINNIAKTSMNSAGRFEKLNGLEPARILFKCFLNFIYLFYYRTYYLQTPQRVKVQCKIIILQQLKMYKLIKKHKNISFQFRTHYKKKSLLPTRLHNLGRLHTSDYSNKNCL